MLTKNSPQSPIPSPQSPITGRIHSLESLGTVDGPGIRFVVFTQGCPLRCLYCHNPDCRHPEDGKLVTVDEIITEIEKYKSYISLNGGVTVTGGEPLMQPEFVKEIFRRCQELGLHTALDTSGYANFQVAKSVVEGADLVLLDIKSYQPETYHKVTGVEIEPTLNLARYLHEIRQPVWIRFVLVPGLTDHPENVEALADFISTLDNVEKIEVLPFHKMGEYKWEKLGFDYQLKDTPIPTPEQIQRTVDIFKSRNLSVVS